jgi:3'-phosphoadenosine 5'-phosphosulfate (PAPS) 3'-phosphatase
MTELNEILKSIGEEHQQKRGLAQAKRSADVPVPAFAGDEHQRRIAAALRLMALQARGSERLRAEATAWIKEDRTPVTIADLLHQAQVQQMIAANFAGDGLVCEEPRSMQEETAEEAAAVSRDVYGMPMSVELADVPDSGRVCWMLDPIDGTKGYIGGRHYAIALGYFVDGEPFFGAMAAPHSGGDDGLAISAALAFAVKGMGAWICKDADPENLAFEPLKTPPEPGPNIKVAISLAHSGALGARLEAMGNIEIVKLDSQAKYLAVATGDIDIYMRQSRNDGQPDVTWDHMPGALIATEAGCTVSQFNGEPFDLRPQPIIKFQRGFLCHRGKPNGPIGDLASELAKVD